MTRHAAHRIACGMAAFLLCSSLPAAESESDAALRGQIAQQRKSVQQQQLEREAACRKQFVVTSCLDKVRSESQAELRHLREQELALDDAQRLERVQDHQRRLADKAQAASARELTPPRVDKPKLPVVKPPAAPKAPGAAAGAALSDRLAQEQRKREQFAARQQEIKAHREAVERRNAERLGAGKRPAQPLSWPPSGSAP